MSQLRRPDRVVHQHGDGHRAHAAGNRRYRPGALKGAGKMYIANKFSVVTAINSDINHRRAGFDPFALHQLGSPHRRDQNVRLGHPRWQITSF